MVKLSVALSGVKIVFKNRTYDALILNCGPNVLKAMLTEIKNNAETPLNITSLIAKLRYNGFNVMRGPIIIDLKVFENVGIITCENS